MHSVGPEPLVDQAWPHDFGLNAGLDLVVGEAPGGIFGQQQLANVLGLASAAVTVCQP
jgi:hypothetical protein